MALLQLVHFGTLVYSFMILSGQLYMGVPNYLIFLFYPVKFPTFSACIWLEF